MQRVYRPADNYALAAFIVGKVPGAMREQIYASLVDDRDARRLLEMVLGALVAGQAPDDAMRFVADHWQPNA